RPGRSYTAAEAKWSPSRRHTCRLEPRLSFPEEIAQSSFLVRRMIVMKQLFNRAAPPLLALALVACAAPPPPAPVEIRSGRIEQIINTTIESNHHSGVGAVVGGLAGLGIGSLIGGGTGRDVAMVAGAIGGALLGNNVQKRYDQPVAGQQIIVRVKSGVLVQITQPANPNLRPGQRVYIEGAGDDGRGVPPS